MRSRVTAGVAPEKAPSGPPSAGRPAWILGQVRYKTHQSIKTGSSAKQFRMVCPRIHGSWRMNSAVFSNPLVFLLATP